MKHVDARRPRLQLPVGACVITVLMSMGTMAGATTIDFETPSLNGEDSVNMSPLEIQGVRFHGFQSGLLVRESAIFPCDDVSATNQAYWGFTVNWGCIEGCCPDQFIGIEFSSPPADAVTHLSLEARSYTYMHLRAYDANGTTLGTTSINPAPGACGLSVRGILEISTERPIAWAEIWSGYRPPPGCYDGCCTFGSTIVIDNVTFDSGPVPATPATWGKLKVLYR